MGNLIEDIQSLKQAMRLLRQTNDITPDGLAAMDKGFDSLTQQAKNISFDRHVSKPYSPAVANRMLKIREALLKNEMDEAFHQLYMIASPNCDKYHDEVWTEMEKIAGEYVC